MDWNDIDWQALERLRATFLAGTTGGSDYWQCETDLASYDISFAQRIGWKWDYVLAELRRRGWTPPHGGLLDWGCGSGIAGRAFLDFFGVDSISGLWLLDRSPLATRFAAKRAGEKYPGLPIHTGLLEQPATLLISHVLTELTPEQIQALADLALQATAVIWVEPGTYEASLNLIAIRERLRDRMQVIAPCLHSTRCGLLAPENERHWCHHFAVPPAEVFQDGHWARFAGVLGVDLRDLPLSFLVLDQRPAPALPAGAMRIVGHPRVYKPHALLLGCDANGVSERRLTKRTMPDEFKRLKKRICDPLQVWRCVDDEVVEARPLEVQSPRSPGD